MEPLTPVLSGLTYHIFNKGNNGEDIFKDENCYRHFLRLYAFHIEPIAETYAFCLLRNHFHLLVRFREREKIDPNYDRTISPTQALSNFFNAYTQATNKRRKRTGKLFREHFRRIVVNTEPYFASLIVYIHRNPQKHQFTDDFRDWPWTSYHALVCNQTTQLRRSAVHTLFGGVQAFRELHRRDVDDTAITPLIEGDFM